MKFIFWEGWALLDSVKPSQLSSDKLIKCSTKLNSDLERWIKYHITLFKGNTFLNVQD